MMGFSLQAEPRGQGKMVTADQETKKKKIEDETGLAESQTATSHPFQAAG